LTVSFIGGGNQRTEKNYRPATDKLLIDFIVFNATFSNISAISYGDQFQWWKNLQYRERTTEI
jgi:hypothetical protein